MRGRVLRGGVWDFGLVVLVGIHPLSCPLSRQGREERERGEGRDWLESRARSGFAGDDRLDGRP